MPACLLASASILIAASRTLGSATLCRRPSSPEDIALTFGGTPLLDGAELSCRPGERLCLVGRNGSGKSTLLKIAAGLVEPDSGNALPPARRVTIRYLPQEPDLSGFATTLAYVEAGLGPGDDPLSRRAICSSSSGLTGEEDPARLSGGESAARGAGPRARARARHPAARRADQPSRPAGDRVAGGDARSGSRSALVLISHDRRFLENLSRATVWLDRGATRRLDSGFADFEAWRDAVLEEEELERHKLDRKIVARSTGCAMASPRGASATSGRLARLAGLAQRAAASRAERRSAT